MKKETIKIPYYYSLPVIILSILLVTAVIYAVWSEPAQSPPLGNVPAPLNVGNEGQAKAGGLILNTGGAAYGLIVHSGNVGIAGNVGIGTTEPEYKLDVFGALRLRPSSAPPDTREKKGVIYYDSGSDKFRCYQGNGWVDCIGTGGGGGGGGGGNLPAGTSGQTLRHDGNNWVANSLLFNNGTSIGIATTTPDSNFKLDVNGNLRVREGNYISLGGERRTRWPLQFVYVCEDSWYRNSNQGNGDCFDYPAAFYTNPPPPGVTCAQGDCTGIYARYRNPSSCPPNYLLVESYCEGDCSGDDGAATICVRAE